jgi:hypothetical protein
VLLVTLAAAVGGCGGYASTTPGESVDVTGQVTGPDGKPVSGFQVVLQPTGGAGQEVFFPLKADGGFAGKVVAGTYTYYLKPGKGAATEQALFKMPPAVRAGSMERQIEVKGGGEPLVLKF